MESPDFNQGEGVREKVKPIYENYHKNKVKIKFSSDKTDLGKLVEKQTKEKQDTVLFNKKIR